MSKKTVSNQNNEDYGIYCTEIASQTDQGNAHLSEHSHGRVEIIYALDVNADIVIGGTPFRFQSGDIAVIAPDTSHFEHISGSGRYFSIKFPSDLLFSPRRGLSEHINLGKFLSYEAENCFFERRELELSDLHNRSSDVHDTMQEIMSEWDKKKEGYEQIIRAGIIKILVKLSRVRSEQSKLLSPSPNGIISYALAYISDNCATATERNVADICGLSLSYFSTLFKSSVGVNFNEYLTKAKLEKAKNLLISTDKSMTFIAYETGFSSSSHFIARFKEHEGITPLKFRKDIRSGKKPHSVITPQFIVKFENAGKPSGKYLIFKYRTNRADSPAWLPFFAESNAALATGKGLTWAVLEGDEKWHVIVIDMTETTQLTDAFLPDDEGKYYAGHIWIHPFYKSVLPTLYIDIEYAAFAESIEQALGIIGDGEDIFHGYFSTAGGDRWIKKKLDANLVPSSQNSLFYTSKEKLLSSIVSSGMSLRKIELLSENGRDFVRAWCM